MSFGRNPHVAKATLAEQKAQDAPDQNAKARAFREAAHLWDRAAEREKPGKQRTVYEQNAIRNRELADGGPAEDPPADDGPDPKLLN